jgi:putative ABC transport system permease protein
MFLSLKIALASLAAHKLRAVLAVLGVFLGALAFTGVQHASLAMVRKAELETEKLGPNLFMATAGQVRMSRSGGPGLRSGSAKTFTLEDARALINGLPSVAQGVPYVAKTMPVRSGATKINCQVLATLPEYSHIRNFRPELGRFLLPRDNEEMAKVCVLGRNIALRLFGAPEKALGRRVLFFRASCEVIGIMEQKGADIVGTDQDEQVFVPLSTFQRRMSNQTWISGVYIELAPGADPELVKASATTLLAQRHHILPGQKQDFSVLTAKDTIKLQRQALDLVQVLGLISSSVSFAVGGLGILSIMVLLVRARRLEIGVRRASGAKRRDIIRQFLFEAGLMSSGGGCVGVACAIGLIAGMARFGGFPFVFELPLAFGALAASALLGIAAGAYPAWQASRIEVLDVLRGAE